MKTEKEKLIKEIKEKIVFLEAENEDVFISSKLQGLNNIAIAKYYETLSKLIQP